MKTNFYKIKLLFAWCLIVGMFNAPLNADQNTDIKDISPEDMALNSVGLVSRDQLKIEIPKETLEQKVAILNDYNDKNVNIKFDNISLGSFQPNDNLGINAMWGIQNLLLRSQMMGDYGPNNPFMYGYAPTYPDSSFLPPSLGGFNMAGTQAIYESSSAGFLSEISSIISSTSGVAGPFAGIVAGAMSAAIIPIVVGFTNPQMTAIMTQYNQSIAEAVSMPMKAANQQYNQLYQGFNDQSMAVGNNILNISKLTGEFNAQGNTQGAQISAVNSQIASILASNTTPKNPSAIEAYATNQIAVPSVPTTVEMMSGILGNITSAAPKYALALQEQLRSQASNSSMNDTADSLDSCTALGALASSSKVFFSCMQISMTPMSVSMPTVYAKYQALATNALTSGVNPMTTPACPIGDKVLVVYCYAEKVAEILREYYIEFVKNNTNLLQNASQMILNQSGLATSTYDTQAISNISSLYNYNIVANKSFLKSHLTYLDYIKDKLKGQKDSYLTERVQTKIIVK